MGSKKHIAVAFFCLFFFIFYAAPVFGEEKVPHLGTDSIREVINAMTLEEKASLVVGTGMNMPAGLMEDAEAGDEALPAVGNTNQLVSGAAGTTFAIPRLGIPAMVLADGPAGLRIDPTRDGDDQTYYCTAFPVATLLASSWDTKLTREVGRAIGNEVIEYGVDILLAPALNIHRNPLCGRNFEYFSEDPLVSGKITAALVDGVQSMGVGTTVKHYAANNAETNRMALDTVVSQRALREIYLEGFRIAVQESQPWAVMSAYNLINGTHASESRDLLTKVLRDDWGYKGFVMTDWMAGIDPVAQMAAGNDMLMPGNTAQSQKIAAAVREGRLDEKVLDKNIERILGILVQSPRFKSYAYSDKPSLDANAGVARSAATDGMVLLENRDGALPISKDVRKIAAFGNTSYDIITGGTGSGDVNEAYSVSLVAGLENAGYEVDAQLMGLYETYLAEVEKNTPPRGFFDSPEPADEMAVPADLARTLAGQADYGIITIGRNSGEGNDRTAEEKDFYLTKAEKTLIENVTDAFHAAGKKCALILNVGGVVETASWRDMPDAVLLAWQAGQETGNAVADVLSGKVNPSGKLATTFPISYDDVPSAKNFPGTVIETASETAAPETTTPGPPPARASEVTYEEGIYVGYRYYDTFDVDTAYPFGYGLSYTKFAYSYMKIDKKTFDGTLRLTVDIKNTGTVPGREVVQLYISAPGKTMKKPKKELKGFAKTKMLAPGETQTLTFEITDRSLASFDTDTSLWIAEPGKYEAKIGASSKDIRQSANFKLKKEIVVKTVSRALAPLEAFEER